MGGLQRREGFRANPKRIYRLWKLEGHRVPRRQHKRRRLGVQARKSATATAPSTRTTSGRSTSSSTGTRPAAP
ncbi:MAG: hypothetical protein ACYC33_12075 [Thermoleophilia bacterium]